MKVRYADSCRLPCAGAASRQPPVTNPGIQLSEIPSTQTVSLDARILEACGDVDSSLMLSYFLGCFKRHQEAYGQALQRAVELEEVAPKPRNLIPRTIEKIYSDCCGILSKHRIRLAIGKLTKSGDLLIHRNPDSQYQLDQTRFYELNPKYY